MSLARNSLYSLVGSTLPLMAAIVTVPLYIATLGGERYGALVIAWTMLGYFGQADFGIGRALTQRIAASRDADAATVARIVWSGISAALVLGVLLAVVTYAAANLFFSDVFKVEGELRNELISALGALALCSPVVMLTGAASGALLGKEQFGVVSLGYLVSNLALQVLPLLAAMTISGDLRTLIVASLAGRGLGLLVMGGVLQARLLRGHRPSLSLQEIRRLARFGGWLMVGTLIAPLMIYSDRFVIGSFMGAAAVAAYTVPYQIAFRTLILPESVVGVLFPRFAALDEPRATIDGGQFSVVIAQAFAPIVIGLICLSEPLMHLWLGAQLDPRSVRVAQIILAGVWCLALASVPWAHIQARGSPRFTAAVVAAELPFYVLLLMALGHAFGLIGFAAAFALRGCANSIVLLQGAKFLTRSTIVRLGLVGALVLAALAWGPYLHTWLQAVGAAMVLTFGAIVLFVHSLPTMPDEVRDTLRDLGLPSLRARPSEFGKREKPGTSP
jgi:O-antigen/teichoic acid export membrane protein